MPNSTADIASRAKALSRWEGEGGALAPSGDDSMDESTLRLLARLGAALLESWDGIPPELQERMLLRAQTMGGPADRMRARDNLDLLLRKRPG